jgi:hypothetical protein
MITNKQATWDIIKRDPELAEWVKEDPALQGLLAECVSLFGIVETELWDDEKQTRRDRAAALRLFNWFANQRSDTGKRPGAKGRL